MKNKSFIIAICIIITIAIMGIITKYADTGRVSTGHEPKYCIRIVDNIGGKITYWGLGYKVIRYVEVSSKEPYENNIGVNMGSWFMKYELPIDSVHNKKEKNEINNLDDFYNTELTKDKDIRTLTKEYSLFDAQKDNCFVIGAMVHNDYLYNEFMENYENQKTSFIRIAQSTIEGDLILMDILYYEKSDKLYLVSDNTRDKFSTEKDRNIELREYENIAEYEYESRLYWVLYDGNINDENFKNEDVFIITIIN